jgi:hypothetical protein
LEKWGVFSWHPLWAIMSIHSARRLAALSRRIRSVAWRGEKISWDTRSTCGADESRLDCSGQVPSKWAH